MLKLININKLKYINHLKLNFKLSSTSASTSINNSDNISLNSNDLNNANEKNIDNILIGKLEISESNSNSNVIIPNKSELDIDDPLLKRPQIFNNRSNLPIDLSNNNVIMNIDEKQSVIQLRNFAEQELIKKDKQYIKLPPKGEYRDESYYNYRAEPIEWHRNLQIGAIIGGFVMLAITISVLPTNNRRLTTEEEGELLRRVYALIFYYLILVNSRKTHGVCYIKWKF